MSVPVITYGDTFTDFVGGLERLHGPVTVVRRCSALAELIAACQTGLARAAIVSGDTSEVGIGVLERLHTSQVAVVVLTDDDGERRRFDALGIAHGPVSMEPLQLADLVTEAVANLPVAGPQVTAGYADPAHALLPVTIPDDQPADLSTGGQVIAVWGPAGSPGRTTVAVNLAAEYAAAGKTTLLIDADTYSASVAAFLGLMDESAALAQACRLADQGILDGPALARVSVKVAVQGAHLQVLTGITRAERWPELRPGAMATVVGLARSLADYTIIDCGFCLEADEELSFDTMAPRRNGTTLRCLELADTVFAVGAADAIGIPRLVRALAEIEQAVPSAAPRVVLNKVRASSIGSAPVDQLRHSWERFGPVKEVQSFLPADFDVADAALLSGSVLLESAPDSPLRHAIALLAGRDLPVRRNGSRRRRRLKV
jgi:MinD-like ATPase involved in chromosome partitioning or flagellar assembly